LVVLLFLGALSPSLSERSTFVRFLTAAFFGFSSSLSSLDQGFFFFFLGAAFFSFGSEG
jgi:hypothetical protein